MNDFGVAFKRAAQVKSNTAAVDTPGTPINPTIRTVAGRLRIQGGVEPGRHL